MAPKKHHSVKHRKRCSKSYKKMMKIKGGDASDYAISVYGGIGQQHAVADNNHVIAMNKAGSLIKGGDADAEMTATPTPMEAPEAPEAVYASSPLESIPNQAGGTILGEANDENEDRLQGGDSVLADLAVPAVLLVANQVVSKGRRKTSKKSRKNRRYRKKRSAKRRR